MEIEINSNDYISSGFQELDGMLAGGFYKSSLTILAGSPAVGKTSLGINLMLNMMAEQEIPCACFSLRMKSNIMMKRLLSMSSKVDLPHIMKGQLADYEQETIGVTMRRFEKYSFHIDDDPWITIDQISSKAKELKEEKGIQFLFVDDLHSVYLDDIYSDVKRRDEQLAIVVRELKAIAQGLDIAVLAVSQVNRSSSEYIRLSSLRDSGSIENVADTVLYLVDSPAEGYKEVMQLKSIMAPVHNTPVSFDFSYRYCSFNTHQYGYQNYGSGYNYSASDDIKKLTSEALKNLPTWKSRSDDDNDEKAPF